MRICFSCYRLYLYIYIHIYNNNYSCHTHTYIYIYIYYTYVTDHTFQQLNPIWVVSRWLRRARGQSPNRRWRCPLSPGGEPSSIIHVCNLYIILYYILCISLICCVYPTWNFLQRIRRPELSQTKLFFLVGASFLRANYCQAFGIVDICKDCCCAPAIACTTDESNKLQDWEQISNVLWHPRAELLLYLFSCWWFGTWLWFFHILGIIIPTA